MNPCTKPFDATRSHCDCGHPFGLHDPDGCLKCRTDALLLDLLDQGGKRMNQSDLAELLARLEICIREEEQAKQQLHQAMARTRACRCDIEDLIGRAS